MQSMSVGTIFQTTVTAYDTASAVIGSVSVSGTNQQVTGTVPVIGATSPKPIAKLVLSSLLIGYPDTEIFTIGTFYFNAGMLILFYFALRPGPWVIPDALQALTRSISTFEKFFGSPSLRNHRIISAPLPSLLHSQGLACDRACSGTSVRYPPWIRP